jgi:membrane protein
LTRFITILRSWWAHYDLATRLLPFYIWRAITNFNNYGNRQAAALAYYTVFSIFPLTLLLATAISRVLGAAVAQQQIANALRLFLPPESTADLMTSITQALDQNAPFGLIAIVGLIWSGLGLFSNVTSSLDRIFHVPVSRSLWRHRLVAVLMIFILVVLVAASFVTSGILVLISTVFFLNNPSTWITVATVFLPLGLNMIIFVLLFRFVPARLVYWDAVWPAAIFGAAGWEIAKAGFRWYLENLANFQVIYGSIATVIVLLFSAYLLASIFIFSAELCAQLNEWLDRRHDSDALRLHIEQNISES